MPDIGRTDRKAAPQWSTREQVATQLEFLRGSAALVFRDAIEATECVRVRLSMTLSESKVTLARLNRFDRAEDDCSLFREVLVYNFRQSQVAAQESRNTDSGKLGEPPSQLITEAELEWLQDTLGLVPKSKSLRRRILNHAKLVTWNESELEVLRRRLAWSVRTIDWLKPARAFLDKMTAGSGP